jgi:hypothetical protein
MRLVAEVNASFEELAHAEIRQSHSLSFPVQASTDLDSRTNRTATGGLRRISPGRKP